MRKGIVGSSLSHQFAVATQCDVTQVLVTANCYKRPVSNGLRNTAVFENQRCVVALALADTQQFPPAVFEAMAMASGISKGPVRFVRWHLEAFWLALQAKGAQLFGAA